MTEARPDMATEPAVSVVIVNWNTRELLLQALSTLHDRTSGITLETIVVDNGSADGSADAVADAWPAVRLVRLPRNRGFAAANNAGFEIATGRYVLLLNSDTIVLPTTVTGLAQLLDEDQSAAAAGARHLNADGSLQRSVDDPPSLLNDFLFFFGNDVVNGLGLTRYRPVSAWLRRRSIWWNDHDRIRPVGWANGACIMVRRAVIEQVGGLDEEFFIYGEELDWCHRIRQAGHRVVFTPGAEVVHLGGQAMNSASDRRVYLKYLGMLTYYRKNLPAKVPAFLLMVRLIAALRIVLISLLFLAEKMGVRVPQTMWRLITQEVVRVPYSTMIHAWWRIFRLSERSRFTTAMD